MYLLYMPHAPLKARVVVDFMDRSAEIDPVSVRLALETPSGRERLLPSTANKITSAFTRMRIEGILSILGSRVIKWLPFMANLHFHWKFQMTNPI